MAHCTDTKQSHGACPKNTFDHTAVTVKIKQTISFDTKVILGVPSGKQTETPVRVVGFESGGVNSLMRPTVST